MMKQFTVLLAAAAVAVVGSTMVRADDKQTGFRDRVYKGGDGDAKYVVFVPHGYKADKEWPLILFLHGSGETGTDGAKQVKVGLGPAIKKVEKDFRFFAVFPQSQLRTWKAESSDAQRALAILEEITTDYKIDPRRIYLTGLSMGGFGTWSLAAKYPQRWAAIVPVCGGGDPNSAEVIKHIPTWCFHGDADRAVPVERSREMIEALKKAGGTPIYTEYPGVAHNSWDRAYGTPELYDWLLKQQRK